MRLISISRQFFGVFIAELSVAWGLKTSKLCTFYPGYMTILLDYAKDTPAPVLCEGIQGPGSDFERHASICTIKIL
jgi:hypothetical protein